MEISISEIIALTIKNRIGTVFNGSAVLSRGIVFVLLSLSLISCGSRVSDSKNDKVGKVDSNEVSASLFNGKNLDGWYTYLRAPEPTSEVKGLKKEGNKYVEPLGLNKDPLNVFSVVQEEGEPAIRISGEVLGVLITEKEFENFHLSLEFKWGEEKYPPRKDKKRDSGVMYYSIGKEGAKAGAWMRSMEMQVQEGDTGDMWCIDSTSTRVRTVKVAIDSAQHFRYDPKATFNIVNMRGERYCQKSGDFEKEYGEWNRLDIYAYERESIHVVNGQKNMHLTDIGQIINGEIEPLTKGKIQLQSEGAEIFYRDITIQPIQSLPHIE
ncbi:DUF1080 domain-containing protein [Muricauda sp. SCSIO 64092]|uniref:3-keto-disaccharide hydrolase n=1 Tax=Allomuricauda sp. SCSIO 64092 TaxID=2908842 RepID=UPI001FF5882A|nr:DUF1080 domain-containing protein [Muricauda sp. SCSIO 64092]UOY05839.1 DUF1080 domain-containing protein [Muricauda sp. SCSIO 64092]